MKRIVVIGLNLTFTLFTFSQSLFESALSNDKKENSDNYSLNGYIKGYSYFGEDGNNSLENKSTYGELDLKLTVQKENFGKAFADFRYRTGFEFGETVNELNLKEAYVSATILKKIDLTIGQQIVVWGRADGFNPTDNITPKNYIIRTPEYDDIREGNFLFQTKYNISPTYTLTGIWIPVYKSSAIPFVIAELPEGVTYITETKTDTKLKNSGFACKLDAIFPKFDGSVSYFNGYSLYPGLTFGTPVFDNQGNYQVDILPNKYRFQVMGIDYSASIFGSGIRGEITYTITDDYEKNAYIPCPEFNYVIGFDRTLDNFSFIIQYIGKLIQDYTKLEKPNDPLLLLNYQEEFYNRLISQQTDELIHMFSARPSINIMYETLQLEAFGLYNITTQESMIFPKIKYQISDAMDIMLGADFYFGKENTLNNLISTSFNSIYFGLKTSF